MLVEDLAVRYAFGGLAQRVPTCDEIGHKVDKQQLPGGEVRCLFYYNGNGQQQGRNDDDRQLAARRLLVVVTMPFVAVAMAGIVMVMMFIVLFVAVAMVGIVVVVMLVVPIVAVAMAAFRFQLSAFRFPLPP